jgi:hypothetical protein
MLIFVKTLTGKTITDKVESSDTLSPRSRTRKGFLPTSDGGLGMGVLCLPVTTTYRKSRPFILVHCFIFVDKGYMAKVLLWYFVFGVVCNSMY